MFQSSCRGNQGFASALQQWSEPTLPRITPARHMMSTLCTTMDSTECSSVGSMLKKIRTGDKEPIGGSGSSSMMQIYIYIYIWRKMEMRIPLEPVWRYNRHVYHGWWKDPYQGQNRFCMTLGQARQVGAVVEVLPEHGNLKGPSWDLLRPLVNSTRCWTVRDQGAVGSRKAAQSG